MRYADRLGDLFSDAHYHGREGGRGAGPRRAARDPARPAQRRPTSSPTTCSSFTTKDTLRGLQPDLLTLTEARPMNHFYGIHT